MIRTRHVAELVGVTERAVQTIVSQLVAHGHVVVHRRGRRNSYEIVRSAYLRHPEVEVSTWSPWSTWSGSRRGTRPR